MYTVETPGGVTNASLRGRVKRRDERIVSVGDLVALEDVDGYRRILELLPRSSALTRHVVARRREQVIVADVDQVVVTGAVRAPQPDVRMIDRLVALAELSGVRALIVANKIDLGSTGELPDVLEAYPAAGYEVLRVSASTGEGLDLLANHLSEKISVLTGASGVGKSSLLNALIPGLDLRVGEVGSRKGRGRHTTVAAALYPYPTGGYVADTPGLQYLSLWDVDPVTVDRGFVEFTRFASECRFKDCRHRSEPGCEVKAAVEDGEILARRYESYLGLLDEAEGI